MKKTGFIQSNLSKRKFKKNLKWINKLYIGEGLNKTFFSDLYPTYYCAYALKYHIAYFDGVCPECLQDNPEETKKVSGRLIISDFMARFLIVFIAIAGFTIL